MDHEKLYLKTRCPSCSGGIEFPMKGIGEEIHCPHCEHPLTLRTQCGSRPKALTVAAVGISLFLAGALFLVSFRSSRGRAAKPPISSAQEDKTFVSYLETAQHVKVEDFYRPLTVIGKITISARERYTPEREVTVQCDVGFDGIGCVSMEVVDLLTPGEHVLLGSLLISGETVKWRTPQKMGEAVDAGTNLAVRIVKAVNEFYSLRPAKAGEWVNGNPRKPIADRTAAVELASTLLKVKKLSQPSVTPGSVDTPLRFSALYDADHEASLREAAGGYLRVQAYQFTVYGNGSFGYVRKWCTVDQRLNSVYGHSVPDEGMVGVDGVITRSDPWSARIDPESVQLLTDVRRALRDVFGF